MSRCREGSNPCLDLWGDSHRLVAVIAIASIFLLAGGVKVLEAKPQPKAPVNMSHEKLRGVLRDFVDRFALIVEAASDEIVAKSDDRQISQQAVLWKMRAIGLTRDLLFKEDPRMTAIDLWAFCGQMQQYLHQGDGADVFGKWQSIALDAGKNVHADIEALSELILTPPVLKRIRGEIDQWVEQNPLRGPLARTSGPQRAIEHRKEGPWRSMLVMTSAINPLQGIDDAKKQAQEFVEKIEHSRWTAEHLPQQFRWEMQLLLYDLENRHSISSALSHFEKLADSFDQLVTEAKQLPAQLRAETVLALDDLAARSDALRLTLSDIRDASASMTETGRAWEAAADAFGRLVPEDRGGAEAKTFELNELNLTANSLTTTAIELRGLAADLHKLAESGELATALNTTTHHGRQLIDHLAWRLFQLILASAMIAVIYRVLATRLIKGDKKASA